MTRAALVLLLAAGSLSGAVLRAQYGIGSSYVTAITHVAAGSDGSIYEVGTTSWPEFPTTPGPLSRLNGSGSFTFLTGEIFIRKRSASTRQIVYSVLIGGSGEEVSTGAAVDTEGNVYVTGTTDSPDFPFTGSPPQGPTGFVLQLNSAGTRLNYALSVGSFTPAGLALAPDRRVVVAGTAEKRDLSTTEDAVQRTSAGGTSAYIMRLSTAGAVDYATYLGGPVEARAYDVAVDPAGDFYVAGFTVGHSFPTLATSFVPQAPFGGFVSKFDHATGQLVYSTYLPGVFLPLVGPFSKIRLAVDSKGHAYVTGAATAGFPATADAFQTEVASDPLARFPGADAFLLELDASGSRLVFATLFGSNGNDHGLAVAVTGDTVTIAGVSSSWFLPVNDFGLPTCNLPSIVYDIGEPYRSFVASFDHEGKRVTAFTFGQCDEGYATDLEPTLAGRLLMTGTASHLKQSFLLDIDLRAAAPVQVTAVANSASLQVGPYAPLELVTIFGSGLGPPQRLSAQPVGGVFPKTLGGTRVLIGGLEAPLLAVAEGRIEAVVPQAVSLPWTTVSVVTAAGTSAPVITWIERATPALFTTDGSGIGQGLILNQDGSRNSEVNRAKPGSTITVFGTGGGLTNPGFADGQLATGMAPLLNQPAVSIGDKYGTVTYAGAVPSLVNGMMQLNVTLPVDLPSGHAVPIVVRSFRFRSQSGVTVAIE